MFPTLAAHGPESVNNLLTFLKVGHEKTLSTTHSALITAHMEYINTKIITEWTAESIASTFAKTRETIELKDYLGVFISISIIHEQGARKHFLVFIFTLTMAIAYQSNYKTINISNRWKALLSSFPELVDKIESPSVEDISNTWILVEKALLKGIKLELLIEKVLEITSSIECPVFTAVMNFVGYSRMTPVRLICEAMNQFTEFPWNIMFQNFPLLKTERDKLIKYLDVIESDSLAGLKYQGISQVIPNLTYLAYQLHVQMGGRISLTNYKGIGSPDNRTTIPLRRVLDESLTRARRDRFTKQYAWPNPGDNIEPLTQETLDKLSKFLGEEKVILSLRF